jgi:peptide/nickel transport system ATP-binding protein
MHPVLKVENLCKRYAKRSLIGKSVELLALDRVSFTIFSGTTLAIVGESGSGKSTLASCLACLEHPSSGSIRFAEKEIANLSENELRNLRPQIQLIFQDPANSLNPRWNALEILLEPLSIANKLTRAESKHRAAFHLERVGLSQKILKRPANELSGGQRQRLAIARALTLEPKVLILDEALSALDCSVQAQIVNLLLDLQTSLGMTYLFITHDLAMAAHLADQIAVMNRGRIVEQGPAHKVLQQPDNETTRQLLAAIPRMPNATLPVEER